MIVGGEKASLSELVHFGVKGMHWGRHEAGKPAKSKTPERPRATTTKSQGRQETRSEQLVSKVINQGYDRATRPAMDAFIRDMPTYKQPTDPRVAALLGRASSQALNRVEQQAGANFMSGLPQTYRR